MAGHPARNLSVRCAASQSRRATCESLQRGSPTAITSATPVTASFASQRSKSMQGRHDNHRRYEVPATNESRGGDPLRPVPGVPPPAPGVALLGQRARGVVSFLYAPRAGGAYDSHHRTAGIAGRTRRRGGRCVAARGARAAIGEAEVQSYTRLHVTLWCSNGSQRCSLQWVFTCRRPENPAR